MTRLGSVAVCATHRDDRRTCFEDVLMFSMKNEIKNQFSVWVFCSKLFSWSFKLQSMAIISSKRHQRLDNKTVFETKEFALVSFFCQWNFVWCLYKNHKVLNSFLPQKNTSKDSNSCTRNELSVSISPWQITQNSCSLFIDGVFLFPFIHVSTPFIRPISCISYHYVTFVLFVTNEKIWETSTEANIRSDDGFFFT